jgi:hypothetical protein
MLSLILFLSTFVGVNWVFYRSLFRYDAFLPDSLGDRMNTPTRDASHP